MSQISAPMNVERFLLIRYVRVRYLHIRLLIDKRQNLHPRRGKFKRTRDMLKYFFSRAIKGKFLVVYRE